MGEVLAFQDEVEAPALVSHEAEQALLAGLLTNPGAHPAVAAVCKAEDFADAVHSRIFEAIGDMLAQGIRADPVTLARQFRDDPGLNRPETPADSRGAKYLFKLLQCYVVAKAEYLADYGVHIADLAKRRRLNAVMADLATLNLRSRDPDFNIGSALESLEGEIAVLRAGPSTDPAIRDMGEIMDAVLEQAEAAYKGGAEVRGIATGLVDLDRILNGLCGGDLLVLGGRPGMGKAQPMDAKVRTTSGWTTMGQIQVGQAVASHDGRYSVVTGKFPQGIKTIYSVEFSDGRSTECCAEHLWRVRYRDWQPQHRTLTTAQVARMLTRKRYQGRLSIDLVGGDFGVRATPAIDPYLLGVLIGDGNLQAQNVRFSSADAHIVERVALAVGPGCAVRAAGGYDYRISKAGGPNNRIENPVVKAVAALGLAGCRSEAKFIPRVFLDSDYSTRIELLRGLLDTDGTVEASGTIRFCTVSERLRDDFAELARSLGAVCRISTRVPTYTHNGIKGHGQRAYIVSVRHPDPGSLLTVPRKLARIPKKYQYAECLRLNFRSIEAVREAEACCIAVSHPDHLYVTDDYIVTHNTAMAMTATHNIAQSGYRVGFESIEMTDRQLGLRTLAGPSGVNTTKVRRGTVTEDDMQSMVAAARDLRGLPIAISASASPTIDEIAVKWRMRQQRHGLDILFVDYLQLVRAPDKKNGRYEEVTAVSNGLKALAKQLNVPVVALAQLSREVEKRDNKRPLMSDLRESGAIEQDADQIVFLYRHEYYLEKEEPQRRSGEDQNKFDKRTQDWRDSLAACAGIAELIVAKNRHGSEGNCKVRFDRGKQRFETLVRDGDSPDGPPAADPSDQWWQQV